MKGIIQKAVLVGTAAAGSVGCYGYRDLVDPCYPERYEYAARHEVKAALAPQVQNGHVLDQTVWNYHFEPGTANLTAGGIEHLAYLARRRPQPDPVLFLQTAQDVVYDPKAPDKMAEERNELDTKRIESIQKFLGVQTAGRTCAFQVQVHDPADVGISAQPVPGVVAAMYGRYGGLPPYKVVMTAPVAGAIGAPGAAVAPAAGVPGPGAAPGR